jgi:hypothetical protein
MELPQGRSPVKLRPLSVPIAAGVIAFTVSVGVANSQHAANEPAGEIPPDYLGNWVCQTVVPGYDLRPPHADASQPLTNTMKTTPSVQILKFSLLTDGSYESNGAKGRYAFDSATKGITWLDGAHASTFSKTEIGRRDDGAPKMGLLLNKRYYGCFKPTRSSPDK